MIPTLGTLTLAAAAFACIIVLIASLASARFSSAPALKAARWGLAGFALLISLASVLLIVALLQSDFRIAYVASYTERALPTGYKLAAFWAGQEGSLLLWAGMIAWMSALAGYTRRAGSGLGEAVTVGVLALICGFFASLLLFAANPFEVTSGAAPADGRGLNPMLQDFAMLAHPPTLFLGYAGFAVPFAALIGALVERRTDARWLSDIRRWILFAWLALGIGIIIGAWWAYIELGWGGYWAWDPVENASLLPWLTATALLHSMIMQEHRGVFKRWNASLLAATFILCIFGTYITRSGIVSSVHSFGESLVGTFFFAFIILLLVGSAAVVAWRWPILAPQRRLESLLEREGVVLVANVILVLMTATTLVGTIFPVLSRWLLPNEVTVGPEFYNRIVAPMGLALVALMAGAPVLVYGRDAGRRLARGLALPGAAGVVLTAATAALGVTNPWALLVAFIASVAIVGIASNLFHSVRLERQHAQSSLAAAMWRLLDANHRRWGGFVVHLGIAVIVIGFAGSSLYPEKSTHQVSPGQSFEAGRYSLTFTGLKEERRRNYTAVVAAVTATMPGGRVIDVSPERRFYDKAEDSSAQVAVRSGLREDLYLILAGWEAGGKVTALQVIVNPLTIWIWIGTGILTLGSIICLLPRLGRVAHAVSNGMNHEREDFTKGTRANAANGSTVPTGAQEDSQESPRRPRRPALEPVCAGMINRADSSSIHLRPGPAAAPSCPS